MRLLDYCLAHAQALLPQHRLSRGLGRLAASELGWLKNFLIGAFVRHYRVDLSEARRTAISDYQSFNDFFTRELASGARPISPLRNNIVSPVDGCVSQVGRVLDGQLIQAKGRYFNVLDLFGGHMASAQLFNQAEFTTLYLSPRDYHRIHMPLEGTLRETIYVPGRLFSVNPMTTRHIPGLFARNERLVAIFDSDHGPFAMVLVGAMIVASIETVWAGQVTPYQTKVTRTLYTEAARQPITLRKGEEMGRFKLGSTVILFLPGQHCRWLDKVSGGQSLEMGEPLAQLLDA